VSLELRVNREKEIPMSKFLQNSRILPSMLFGFLAVIALMSAAPVTPAHAQGVPAGLLRLDPPRPSNDIAQLSDDQRAKVRGAYAHSKKIQPRQQ
jgi:hypothetical protein